METIKVSVDVKVDFSESTKQFISQLVSSIGNAAPAPAAPTPAPAAPTPASVAPAAAPAPTPAPTAPAPTPTAPTQAPAAPTPVAPASAAPEVTIEQVRQALAAKVNGHREEIKAQLSKFGAPSVTRLDPSHYTDMLIFLNSLA